jgi:hypothetical protein
MMNDKMKLVICFIIIFTSSYLISSCKKNESGDWSETDLQSLQEQTTNDNPPPLQVIAHLRRIERNVALKIFDAWAARILSSQKQNPNSPLNQLRKIFNPDHLKPMTMDAALAVTRQEGSGTHGVLTKERKPQDFLYHALWSRIADAAGLIKYPRASSHMKHFLSNTGKPIRYSQKEALKIMQSVDSIGESAPDPIGMQLEIAFLQEEMKKKGFEISHSESQMIAGMNRNEKTYYIARLMLRRSLSSFIREKKIETAREAVNKISLFKSKKIPTKSNLGPGVWQSHRPLAQAYRLISSQPQSDMYFAMGTFSTTHVVSPLELRAEDDLLKIRFSQWKNIYDRYNWDEGKFVTLLSGWCWNLKSDDCFNIEELVSLQVSDKSLSRLHKLGIAREYEIFGQTPASTLWDGVSFKDLLNPQKNEFWRALITVLYSAQSDITDPLESEF